MIFNHGECPSLTRREDYIGEADWRINNSRDNNSHILRHSNGEGHIHVWDKDFKALDHNYSSAFKRKISEALFIKHSKPSVNVKEKKIRLHLYN